MTTPSEFPSPLLTAPWPARLRHFQDFTVAQPRLVDAKERLLAAIRECAPNSVILVLGPTGVGKTTLRTRVEQLLTAESLAALQTDPARLPVVSVEAVAPPSGNFNWRDHFRRMLYEMNEPLIDQKRKMEGCDVDVHFMPGIKAHGEQYHYAWSRRCATAGHAPFWLMKHSILAKMASGRRLLDQLDVIKSIANRTGTVHVLFGTYDLLAFRNLSGQLSRRSVDVHFCRYRAGNAEDRRTFLNVLGSFERQMPLPEPPDLGGQLGVLIRTQYRLRGRVERMAGESARRGLEPRRLEAHSPGSGGTGAYDLAVREDAGRGNRRRSAIDGERRSPRAFPPGARIAGHRG